MGVIIPPRVAVHLLNIGFVLSTFHILHFCMLCDVLLLDLLFSGLKRGILDVLERKHEFSLMSLLLFFSQMFL